MLLRAKPEPRPHAAAAPLRRRCPEAGHRRGSQAAASVKSIAVMPRVDDPGIRSGRISLKIAYTVPAVWGRIAPASVKEPPKIPSEHRPQHHAQEDGPNPWPWRGVAKTAVWLDNLNPLSRAAEAGYRVHSRTRHCCIWRWAPSGASSSSQRAHFLERTKCRYRSPDRHLSIF